MWQSVCQIRAKALESSIFGMLLRIWLLKVTEEKKQSLCSVTRGGDCVQLPTRMIAHHPTHGIKKQHTNVKSRPDSFVMSLQLLICYDFCKVLPAHVYLLSFFLPRIISHSLQGAQGSFYDSYLSISFSQHPCKVGAGQQKSEGRTESYMVGWLLNPHPSPIWEPVWCSG